VREEFAKFLLVTPEEAKADVQARIDALKDLEISDDALLKWYDDTNKTLDHIFVKGGSSYFSSESGFVIARNMRAGTRKVKDTNLPRSTGILRRILQLIDHFHSQETTPKEVSNPVGKEDFSKKIFIVHGHDEKRILEVKEVIRSQSLQPVVLKDEPNGGTTIIEKFERNADVGFAVILLTADDTGKARSDQSEPRYRARQNVILELGYFIGRLTRARVCALADTDLEVPSDIHGLIYTPLDTGGAWRYKLVDELKLAGYITDKNAL
jgi:predicted nucleotide-binding protein